MLEYTFKVAKHADWANFLTEKPPPIPKRKTDSDPPEKFDFSLVHMTTVSDSFLKPFFAIQAFKIGTKRKTTEMPHYVTTSIVVQIIMHNGMDGQGTGVKNTKKAINILPFESL